MTKTVRLDEYKCFDCDQIFLIRHSAQAKYCPRCGSDRIQFGAETVWEERTGLPQ